MVAGVAAMAGFALGLYAGKRRANGQTWCLIGHELYDALWRGIHDICNRIRRVSRYGETGAGLDGRTAV